jgi:hypothetical protein
MLKLELQLFTQPDAYRDHQSVVHVYTTRSAAPHFVTVDTRKIPCVVEIPTTFPYDNLCIEHYVSYLNEENFTLLNRAGVAILGNRDFNKKGSSVAFKKDDGGDAGIGRVTLRIADDAHLPSGTCAYACTPECHELCATIRHRACNWYKTLEPIDPEISKVHVPELPCFVPKLPGFFFMVKRPTDFEDERFFTNALSIAAARRDLGDADLEALAASVWAAREERVAPDGFMKLASIVVEALSIASNLMPYNADVELNSRASYRAVDRFSSDARVNKNGDCEDEAREVLNLTYSLQVGTYYSPLVVAAQFVCRCYLATQQFGAVELGSDPSLAVYSTGGRLFAHSFVIFLPAGYVAASVQDATLESYMQNPYESGVETLTTDGISLFDPKPMHPDHPCVARKLRSIHDLQECDTKLANKLKSFSAIGNHYYIFLCSAFVLNGLVNTNGVPVYELYFTNRQGHYGCKFEEVLQKLPTVKLIPTYTLTRSELELAVKCTSVLHPVPPYTVSRKPAYQAKFYVFCESMKALGVRLLSSPPSTPGRVVTVFVNGNEIEDHDFATQLGSHLRGTRVLVAFEYLADDLYGAKLDLYF